MSTQEQFLVRLARPQDAAAIVALERSRFGGIGTDCYQEAHVRAWYETCPEGLVVAERDGHVVAHSYAQRRHFTFDLVAALTTHDEETDRGYTRSTHQPDGNAWYGVSICSAARGAMRSLLGHIFGEMRTRGMQYFVGASRISGFDIYVRGLENANIDWRAKTTEGVLALWYAHACAALSGAPLWPTFPPAPQLDLPAPPPDGVLNRHFQFPGYGPAALLPKYMHDPASRDYGIFVVFEV